MKKGARWKRGARRSLPDGGNFTSEATSDSLSPLVYDRGKQLSVSLLLDSQAHGGAKNQKSRCVYHDFEIGLISVVAVFDHVVVQTE